MESLIYIESNPGQLLGDNPTNGGLILESWERGPRMDYPGKSVLAKESIRPDVFPTVDFAAGGGVQAGQRTHLLALRDDWIQHPEQPDVALHVRGSIARMDDNADRISPRPPSGVAARIQRATLASLL